MPIKNLTLGAVLLLAGTALAQNHHNTHISHRTHVVKRGETIEKIAKWTGVSRHDLVVANNLHTKKFRPGLVLYIPGAASSGPKHYNLNTSGYAPYTIRKHDSDWKIASMFHMTPQAVRHLNPGVAWSHPHPGAQIRIPMKNAFVYKLARIPVLRSRYAVVARPDTIVRAAPGSNARRIGKVDRGREVRVLDRDDHWYKVRFDGGTEGWVRGDLLVAVQPSMMTLASYHPNRTHRNYAEPVSHHHAKSNRSGRSSRRDGFYANLPSSGGDMLGYAQTWQGTPYRYGAASRSATDCSAFTMQVLRHEGIKMPRTAAEQSTRGQHVDGGNLKPGDLVFFHTSRGSRISHVGIYMGNGKFIHASSGGGKVQVNSLDEGYYKRRFATARRVAKVGHHSAKAEQIAKAHREDESAMKAAEREMKKDSSDGGI